MLHQFGQRIFVEMVAVGVRSNDEIKWNTFCIKDLWQQTLQTVFLLSTINAIRQIHIVANIFSRSGFNNKSSLPKKKQVRLPQRSRKNRLREF